VRFKYPQKLSDLRGTVGLMMSQILRYGVLIMKKLFRKLRFNLPNAESNTFNIVATLIGIMVAIFAWRFPVQPSTNYPSNYFANEYLNGEYIGFAMVETNTHSIPSEAIELEDYLDINEKPQLVDPIIVSENVMIMEGRTYRNNESQLTISPTTIFSASITANITPYGQDSRLITMRSGQVERFTLRERTFGITLDEINWSVNRNNSHIVISIREYSAE